MNNGCSGWDVPIRRDRGDLHDLGGDSDRLGVDRREFDVVDGGLGAALEVHGLASRCDVLNALG